MEISKKWRRTLVAVVLAISFLFVGRRAQELAADPSGDKVCQSLFIDGEGELQTAGVEDVTLTAVSIRWSQEGGTINDASCVNQTPVYGIVDVRETKDVRNAIMFAGKQGLKVSIAGVKHSMGGHAFVRDGLVLDMTKYNQVTLDEAEGTITAQSGATWHDIQNLIHPKYAVKAMQSTDIFTVGGSISVNAHGMDHQAGSVGGTIRQMRVMLPDGSIKTLSRTQDPEHFALVIGGYGLFGVILDAEIEITENVVYETSREVIDYQDFPAVFEAELLPNENLGLFYGHLSTSPGSLLEEMILYKYEAVDAPDAQIMPELGEVSSTKLRRFVLNYSKQGDIPMRLKWFAEKYIEPRMESCTVNRNQAMKDGEACLVSRNEPMHDSVKYLQNDLKNETDILHEYYIPRAQFVAFVDGLREIVVAHDVNLLNASVRVIHPEDNFLNYAPDEMFSVVLYINQATDEAGHAHMRVVTQELIDLAIGLDGTFFLPYQLYYTPEQFAAAYPNVGEFFAAKREYDPDELLSSTFYERYGQAFDQ